MRSLWLRSLLVVALASPAALAARRPVTSDDAAKIPDPPKYGSKKTVKAADSKDMLQTLTDAGNFTTLVKLVNEAGLTDTFTGPGPMTLFAPDDAAFKKLGKKQLDALAKDPEKLKGVLLYHVASGKMTADDLAKMNNGTKLRTSGPGEITLSNKSKKLKVDKANVTKTDIVASDGVIQVVDNVLTPPAPAKAAKTGKGGKKKK